MINTLRRTFLPALFLLMPLLLPAADRTPKVLNGIDVLRAQNFAPLAGKRVGLITNHTGLAADGTTTIDLLYRSKVCRLAALFSPEHGIRGVLDDKVGSSVDAATGITVHSLYGNSKRPSQDVLKKLDALVFDVQDIGARFYTYITTMGYCMEEAAKAGIPFYVLDRPNPIGGVRVQGPMLDADRISFIGYMPLPVRHGMTVGELARYFNAEKKIGARLQVVEMSGWLRSHYFWDTGQLWVNPSPNMRTMEAALLYPGVCLLESTNVSVGRGTDRPFEIVGAPWIEPRRLAASLEAMQLPGVRYVPLFFAPTANTYRGKKCGGVSLTITDADKLNPVLLGYGLISILNKLYPKEFDIDKVITQLGNKEALKLLKAAKMPVKEEILSNSADFQKFLEKRRKVLIYDLETIRKEGRQGWPRPIEGKKGKTK
jgi:uncharacterized protein YbbC (DUF1343 family)